MLINFGVADIRQKSLGDPVVVVWWWDSPYTDGYCLEACPFPYWNPES